MEARTAVEAEVLRKSRRETCSFFGERALELIGRRRPATRPMERGRAAEIRARPCFLPGCRVPPASEGRGSRDRTDRSLPPPALRIEILASDTVAAISEALRRRAHPQSAPDAGADRRRRHRGRLTALPRIGAIPRRLASLTPQARNPAPLPRGIAPRRIPRRQLRNRGKSPEGTPETSPGRSPGGNKPADKSRRDD